MMCVTVNAIVLMSDDVVSVCGCVRARLVLSLLDHDDTTQPATSHFKKVACSLTNFADANWDRL